MKSYKLSELSKTLVDCLKARPRIDFSSIFSTVQRIVDDVRNRGDAAVTELVHASLILLIPRGLTKFKIIERVADLPDPQLDPAVKEAFDVPYGNIYAFHFARKAPPVKVENMKGVGCKRVSRCITSMSLYVPGGTAVYLQQHSCLQCLHRLQDAKLLLWLLPQKRWQHLQELSKTEVDSLALILISLPFLVRYSIPRGSTKFPWIKSLNELLIFLIPSLIHLLNRRLMLPMITYTHFISPKRLSWDDPSPKFSRGCSPHITRCWMQASIKVHYFCACSFNCTHACSDGVTFSCSGRLHQSAQIAGCKIVALASPPEKMASSARVGILHSERSIYRA
ncbi:hypothetical protein MKW98_013482 [Papaver atlanticum]|uniref:Uncharacterized protein n=1 Tax=Papaver atlanticum TaxID=357466 RepID=A0AAD4SUK3_9MAGN|nr:hypothetical protein MKW98_013482 [Papaver atlanticum]